MQTETIQNKEGNMPNTYIGIHIEYAFYCAVLVILTLIFGGAIIANEDYDCHHRWEHSGLESRYRLRGGCQIKILDEWVSEERYAKPRTEN